MFGAMFGAIGFALWFLEELGAPPQIFGPYSVVGVAVEIPGFFFVGRLIRRFGPIPCVCVATAALSGRLLGYALLGNPWLVLLLEPLHGVAVALMQASATTYVAWVSPPGMAATSQGLLGGVLHILGQCTYYSCCSSLWFVLSMQRPTRDLYNGETSLAFSLQAFISFLLLLLLLLLLRIGKKVQ